MSDRITGVAGVILAGGLARRMGGGDKGLKEIAGVPILTRIIDRVSAQASPIAINANGDPARFSTYGMPVLPDVIDGYAGPLAGVLTGLEWARMLDPTVEWVATFPSDAPFVPLDLVARLIRAVEKGQADMACARSDGRDHPVVGLWPVRLADDLREAMIKDDIRKVDLWTARHRLAKANFEVTTHDPFFNANRPEDLEKAEQLVPHQD